MFQEVKKKHSPESNFNHLIIALRSAYQILTNYINRQENQGDEEISPPTTDNSQSTIDQTIAPYALEDVCKIFELSDFERFVLDISGI